MTSRRIVIVGAGPAGVGAAMAARQQNADAHILLLSDEHHEPYERPPLSKAVLTGKASPHDAPIAGAKGIAGHGVELWRGVRASSIDRAARSLVTAGGDRVPYDALVLATGSFNRILPMFPPDRPGVYYLRTLDESLALKAHFSQAPALALIGGGLIGLEVASSAASIGIKTTVIEIAPRILARVCDEETAALVLKRHREHGVDVHVGTSVKEVRESTLVLSDGATVAADAIVVGAGALADDAIAKAAGLDAADGVIVDDHGRTSDAAIFAAGDCTRFPGPHGPVRVENWRHAQEHGTIAGRNAAGGDVAYTTAPSFWSEQYDLYIQGVGWQPPHPTVKVRRSATLTFELDGDRLTYAMGINAQRDIAAARRLIERRVPVTADDLANPAKPLADLLKPNR